MAYWHAVLAKLKAKKLQCRLSAFYDRFMETYVEEPADEGEEQTHRVITSPVLGPIGSVAVKFLSLESE
jgi:hypothetical protein